MTNASDGFFSGGQGLNYGPTTDTRWLGRWRGGLIVSEPREEQQTNITTKQPMFWDDARTRPMMQLVFTVVCDGSGPAAQYGLPTDERVDHADQGHRSVYIKGKDKTEAIKGQLQQHGRPGLRVGDHYYECWTGMRKGLTEGTTARTWDAKLFPGAGQAQTQFFGNEQQPAAPAASSALPSAGQPQHIPAWSGAPAGPAPNPGPPPQFGQQPPAAAPAAQQWGAPPVQQPAYQPPAAPGGFGQAPPQYAPPAAQQAPPSGFGAPPVAPQPEQPPVNPWGQAPPVQNPYAG